MTSLNPQLSVIICTYNRVSILKQTLRAILDQTLSADSYEVIVVDNQCTDGTTEYVQERAGEHGNLVYILETNQGLSHARNRGIREAKSDQIVFIDDDAIAPGHFVQTYLAMFNKYADVDCIGGRVVPRVDFKVPRWMMAYYKNYLILGYDQGTEELFLDKRHGPVGANMAFRRRAFERHGWFDVNLGRTGDNFLANEEEKLIRGIKARRQACVYTPDAYVVHVANRGRSGRRSLLKRAYDKGVSDARAGGAASHFLGQPIWKKTAKSLGKMVIDLREVLLFHGVIMSVVYRYSYYAEKLRRRSAASKDGKPVDGQT